MEQKLEGDFRYVNSRLITNSEEVIPFNDEAYSLPIKLTIPLFRLHFTKGTTEKR